LPGERIAGVTAALGDQFSIASGSFSSRRQSRSSLCWANPA